MLKFKKNNRFDLDGLFLRIYQAYHHCTNVLHSCATREQLQATGDWIIDVISVFEEEINLYTSHCSRRKKNKMMNKFAEILDSMTNEWKEYVTTNPLMQEPEQQTEQYKETVIVKGFEDLYDEQNIEEQ